MTRPVKAACLITVAVLLLLAAWLATSPADATQRAPKPVGVLVPVERADGSFDLCHPDGGCVDLLAGPVLVSRATLPGVAG
jgi:hypothetical protein